MTNELPSNTEIEGALLGLLLIRNNVYDDVRDTLEAHHFYSDVHQRLYSVVGDLIDARKEASPLTVQRAFENDAALREVGGKNYVWELAASVISTTSGRQYAETIRDLYMKRELIVACETAIAEAMDGMNATPARSQVEGLEGRLLDVVDNRDEHEAVSLKLAGEDSLYESEAAYRNKGKLVGVTTGLADLDSATGGMTPGSLVVLAARPSMGKSALAQNIAIAAAKSGVRTAFFSLEMPREEVARRQHAIEAGVPSDRIRRGQISQAEWERLIEAQDNMADIPVLVDDRSAPTVAAIRSRARRLQRNGGLGLIVIDYLQLFAASFEAQRKNSRVAELSEITAALKSLAKELKVPVLALSQLSRRVEDRDDKRPRLPDLRESGSIEQDADSVWFIYREEYYLSKEEPRRRTDEDQTKFSKRWNNWVEASGEAKSKAEIIIAKQRQGPVKTVSLFFDGPLMKFTNAYFEQDQAEML